MPKLGHPYASELSLEESLGLASVCDRPKNPLDSPESKSFCQWLLSLSNGELIDKFEELVLKLSKSPTTPLKEQRSMFVLEFSRRMSRQ